MAREPIVKIEGNKVDKILTVSYGITNNADADGRPTKNRVFNGINISRVADDNKSVAGWAESSAKDRRKAGTVEFLHNDGKSMKTLKWEEGYVASYDVGYSTDGDHAIENFTIMARVMEIDGSEKIDYMWEEGR